LYRQLPNIVSYLSLLSCLREGDRVGEELYELSVHLGGPVQRLKKRLILFWGNDKLSLVREGVLCL
jgi:hypothetical protein